MIDWLPIYFTRSRHCRLSLFTFSLQILRTSTIICIYFFYTDMHACIFQAEWGKEQILQFSGLNSRRIIRSIIHRFSFTFSPLFSAIFNHKCATYPILLVRYFWYSIAFIVDKLTSQKIRIGYTSAFSVKRAKMAW